MRYCDIKNKEVERAKNKISTLVKQSENDLKVIEKTKDPKVKEKIQRVKKALLALKRWLVLFGATFFSIASVYVSIMILEAFNEFVTRRRREREAARRFREWHERNGRPQTPTPIPPQNPIIRRAEADLERNTQGIRQAAESLTRTIRSNPGILSQNGEGARFASLDYEEGFSRHPSPNGEGRFAGLDYDSDFRRRDKKNMLVTHYSMPWIRDAGVKGMKKGQHVKAHDPDYVESLKGNGGGDNDVANGGGSNNGQPQKQSKLKKALKIGAGVAGGLAAAALLANGAGRLIANRQMAKKFAQKKLAERAANKAATKTAKARTAAHINKMNNNLRESQKTWGTLTNTSKLKKALGDPNYVFDI